MSLDSCQDDTSHDGRTTNVAAPRLGSNIQSPEVLPSAHVHAVHGGGCSGIAGSSKAKGRGRAAHKDATDLTEAYVSGGIISSALC
jgi:hypothetical protein